MSRERADSCVVLLSFLSQDAPHAAKQIKIWHFDWLNYRISPSAGLFCDHHYHQSYHCKNIRLLAVHTHSRAALVRMDSFSPWLVECDCDSKALTILYMTSGCQKML
jgi:hypothetical protein